MAVKLYYGSLADATITEGDVACTDQYPITNLNYLDKGLYAEFDDDDSDALSPGVGSTAYDIIKIDFESAEACSGCVLELDSFTIDLSVVSEEITSYDIKLQRSSDDSTYTTVATLYTKAVGDTDINETLTDIYSQTFTEAEYRYWKIILAVSYDAGISGDTLTWDIAGNINNLYIGDYLEMPSPEINVANDLEHDVEIMTSYGGKRVAIEKQEQRKIWNYEYTILTDTEKENLIAFDVVAGKGKIPVYFENVSGSTQIEDLTYCRVTNETSTRETASGNHATSQTIEEEL